MTLDTDLSRNSHPHAPADAVDPQVAEFSRRLHDDLAHGEFSNALSDLKGMKTFSLDGIFQTLKALFNSFASPEATAPSADRTRSTKPDSVSVIQPAAASLVRSEEPTVAPASADITIAVQTPVAALTEPDDRDPQAALADIPGPTANDDTPREGPKAILDQDRRDTDAPDPTFSESDHARAASFGAVASLPGEGNVRMERGADMYGLWSIGSGVGGGIDVDAPDGDPNPKAKKDNDDDGIDDDLEDLRSALDDITEHQRIEQERQDTMSQDALDAMAWQGDADETWDVGGITASRRTIYNAAKSVRKNIGKLATDNNWTQDERADQEYWLSEIERNTKLGNKDAVADDETHLKPETAAALAQQEARLSPEMKIDASVSRDTAKVATAEVSNADASSAARADLLDEASELGPSSPRVTTTAAEGAALSNPPKIALKEEFTPAASLPKAPETAAQVAAIAPPLTQPKLSQSLDI